MSNLTTTAARSKSKAGTGDEKYEYSAMGSAVYLFQLHQAVQILLVDLERGQWDWLLAGCKSGSQHSDKVMARDDYDDDDDHDDDDDDDDGDDDDDDDHHSPR